MLSTHPLIIKHQLPKFCLLPACLLVLICLPAVPACLACRPAVPDLPGVPACRACLPCLPAVPACRACMCAYTLLDGSLDRLGQPRQLMREIEQLRALQVLSRLATVLGIGRSPS